MCLKNWVVFIVSYHELSNRGVKHLSSKRCHQRGDVQIKRKKADVVKILDSEKSGEFVARGN